MYNIYQDLLLINCVLIDQYVHYNCKQSYNHELFRKKYHSVIHTVRPKKSIQCIVFLIRFVTNNTFKNKNYKTKPRNSYTKIL